MGVETDRNLLGTVFSLCMFGLFRPCAYFSTSKKVISFSNDEQKFTNHPVSTF